MGQYRAIHCQNVGIDMSSTRYYSPLRYPGGKGKISGYIKLILEQNLLLDCDYIEPYAGGASVAIDLLLNEFVSSVHINDIDFSVYSFWFSVLNYTDQFCEKIFKVDLTIDEWRKQKEIQVNKGKYSVFDVGFSTFFLNRTNRSGILTAGVIGGINQSGKWKIDARFSKENLIKRIHKLADYKDRIYLYNEDAVTLVKRLHLQLSTRAFFYLDPPYYNKGKELYTNYYVHKNHEEIAFTMHELKDRFWLISYDNVPQIRKLYEKFRQKQYSLMYSAAQATKGSEVLIFSDNLTVPDIQNPTKSIEIKTYYQANY